MRRPLLLLVLVLVVAACCGCGGQPSAPGVASSSGAGAGTNAASTEAPAMPGSEEENALPAPLDPNLDRVLPFKITRVFLKQRPTNLAPYHSDGGDWTYLNARIEGTPAVNFTLGYRFEIPLDDEPASGEGRLIVPDKIMGGNFIARFQSSFGGTLTKEVERPFQPRPLPLALTLLGENLRRDANGDFLAIPGQWNTTRCVLEADGYSGELFLNFSIKERLGEFREKDAGFAEDLLTLLTEKLRDGPPPDRTPEDDASITTNGPKVGKPRLLTTLTHAESGFQPFFSPDSRLVLIPREKGVQAVDPADPQAKLTSPVALEGFLAECHPAGNFDLLLTEILPPPTGGGLTRTWWFDGKSRTKSELRPASAVRLAHKPLSPDFRFIAFARETINANDETGRQIEILDRETGALKSFPIKPNGFDVIDWKRTNAGYQAVASTLVDLSSDQTRELYLADPATGKFDPMPSPEALAYSDDLVSPDERFRARVFQEHAVVTERATGIEQSVGFGEDARYVDRRLVQWASPRYLVLSGSKPIVIDVEEMKLGFPLTPGDFQYEGGSFRLSPDLRWALFKGRVEEGAEVFLAPVEVVTQE